MADSELLPIKVVLHSDSDFRDPGATSRLFAPLCEVDSKYRRRLVGKVETVREAFQESLDTGLPAVAMIKLKDAAQQKSYRPASLFNEDTCPVIGVSKAGTLLASVTREGLLELESRIQSGTQDEIVSHLSALDDIAPYSAVDTLGSTVAALRKKRGKGSLRVKLFRHGNKRVDTAIDSAWTYPRLVGAGFGLCGLLEL